MNVDNRAQPTSEGVTSELVTPIQKLDQLWKDYKDNPSAVNALREAVNSHAYDGNIDDLICDMHNAFPLKPIT